MSDWLYGHGHYAGKWDITGQLLQDEAQRLANEITSELAGDRSATAENIVGALREIETKYKPHKQELMVVPIDDLKTVLRTAEKAGFTVRRIRIEVEKNGEVHIRRTAIWHVLDRTVLSGVLQEIYVDATRSIEPGKILMVAKPEWKPMLQFSDPWSPPIRWDWK